MKNLDRLVSRSIKKIYMNEDYLKFETNYGNLVLTVVGDCCSQSVFYDFVGVKKLLSGNKIVKVEVVTLTDEERKIAVARDNKRYQEEISVYGYRIITQDPILGEVSSVFSFRNYSNGYYGGWMDDCADRTVAPEITDDIIEAVERVKEEK